MLPMCFSLPHSKYRFTHITETAIARLALCHQKYVDTWPSQQYVLVGHPITELVTHLLLMTLS